MMTYYEARAVVHRFSVWAHGLPNTPADAARYIEALSVFHCDGPRIHAFVLAARDNHDAHQLAVLCPDSADADERRAWDAACKVLCYPTQERVA